MTAATAAPGRRILALLAASLLVLLGTGSISGRAAAAGWSFAPSGLDGAGFQNVVAFSPFPDADGNRPALLGADVAGIHRSVDGGRTWVPSDAGLGNPHVASLLFSAVTPGKVYAATDSALVVSTDFGAHWTARPGSVNFDANGRYQLRAGQEHPRSTGRLIAQDTSGPTPYLYVATATQGVKRSSDDGATWQRVALAGDHLRSIALDPADPDRLYVGDAQRGLEVSTDARGAMTFTHPAGGPAVPEELAFVGGRLYVAGGTAGIFSFDGAWHPLNTGIPLGPAWQSITGYVDAASGQDVLYVGCSQPSGGMSTLRSSDGGASWVPLSIGTGVTAHDQEYGSTTDWWAADKNFLDLASTSFVTSDIAVDPTDPSTVLVAGRGGAYAAVQSDSGVDWWPADRGLMVTVDMAVVADPRVAGRVYVGNMDWTLITSADGGRTFLGDTLPAGAPSTGDSLALDVDGPPGTPSTVYLGASVRGQGNGGGHVYSNPDPVAAPAGWTDEALPVSADVPALGVGHALSGERVVLASVTGHGLYRKSGDAWATVGGTAPFPSGGSGSFAWVPGSPVVYAMDGGGIWRSDGAGAPGSWVRLGTASAQYGNVDSLALDPVHAGVLYASDDSLGGVVRFSGADTATPVRTTILPLTDPGPIAAGPGGTLLVHDRTGSRLLASADPAAAAAFADVGDPFYADQNAAIRSLAVGPDGSAYTASTSGGVSLGTPPGPAAPDAAAPSAAADLHAAAVSGQRVDLAWTAASDDVGVAGYRVVRDGVVVAWTSATGWSDLAATPGTQHIYTVRAVDSAGLVGADADPLAVTPPGPPRDTVPPSTPAPLTVRVMSPSQVLMSWPAGSDDVGVTGYRILRDGSLLTTVTGLSATDAAPTPGAHTYSVQAFDAAGNLSPAATGTATVPAPASSGLTGTYFDTATLTTQKLVRTDRTVDFSWGTGSPAKGIGADTFSARWTGRLLPAADGAWTFYTQSDQGVRLWIDGAPVIDNWTGHTLTENKATVTLTADQAHDLRIEYYDKTGTATMRLLWSGPGTPKQVIPATRLLAG